VVTGSPAGRPNRQLPNVQAIGIQYRIVHAIWRRSGSWSIWYWSIWKRNPCTKLVVQSAVSAQARWAGLDESSRRGLCKSNSAQRHDDLLLVDWSEFVAQWYRIPNGV